MKTRFILFVSALIIVSCSQEDSFKETIKGNIYKYLTAMANKAGQNEKIDSVQVSKIDTLSEKDCINLRIDVMSKNYALQSDIVQNLNEQIVLLNGLGQDLISIKTRDRDEEQEKLDAIMNKYLVQKEMLEKADSVKLKCYLVYFKMFITQNESAKELEGSIPVNLGLKPINWEDL